MTSLVGKKGQQTLLCCRLAVNMDSPGHHREVLAIVLKAMVQNILFVPFQMTRRS